MKIGCKNDIASPSLESLPLFWKFQVTFHLAFFIKGRTSLVLTKSGQPPYVKGKWYDVSGSANESCNKAGTGHSLGSNLHFLTPSVL